MVILEEPYISKMLIRYLEDSGISVLENNYTKRLVTNNINIKSEFDYIGEYYHSKKIYTTSEHSLDWISSSLNDYDLNRQISLLKNKANFRKACSNLYPDLFFLELAYTELFTFDISELQLPLVIKPSVGFLSRDVYIILTINDWNQFLEDILKNVGENSDNFPKTVIDRSSFILESYIKGKEFAIDLYFSNKEPIIVNIFEHPFSSERDVSDKLYITNKEIFDTYLFSFTEYISHLNKVLDLDNIPVHVELRIDGGKIFPIEINPLRFTGMCLNELSYYITGTHPLVYYFSNTTPDYNMMWKGKENETYLFSMLEKNNHSLNVNLGKRHYSKILEIRELDNSALNIHAFVFSKTNNIKEISSILEL